MKRLLLILPVLFIITTAFATDDPTVYVTRTGKKYHNAGCSYLKSSSIPMKLSEAAKSYSPCSRCNPPTLGADSSVPSAAQEKSVAPSTPSTAPSNTKSGETAVGQTPTGKTIYEGPRGGHYHYSKSGKKVYERRKR